MTRRGLLSRLLGVPLAWVGLKKASPVCWACAPIIRDFALPQWPAFKFIPANPAGLWPGPNAAMVAAEYKGHDVIVGISTEPAESFDVRRRQAELTLLDRGEVEASILRHS